MKQSFEVKKFIIELSGKSDKNWFDIPKSRQSINNHTSCLDLPRVSGISHRRCLSVLHEVAGYASRAAGAVNSVMDITCVSVL